MAPSHPRLRILSVGGNAVSAFLSWRLQATNACDVTLVWKSGFEHVSQYGISFKSKTFGNERFKPLQVVRTPEEASQGSKAPFDYVLLCVKALPDVYEISAIIESVVTPQHTCVLLNTTYSLGVETYIEQRFPTNIVLSLVSGAELVQLGPSDFEHRGTTDVWVGPANPNPSIPSSIQADMAEALAMTLASGRVDCQVSSNIRQQQYERMIGPVSFHPASVLFDCPNHAELLEKVGVRSLVSDTIDELIRIATAQGCKFPDNFKERIMEEMIRPSDSLTVMYQDYTARRPMEVETYLGSPLKFAQEAGVAVPRIETLYALLHNANISNQMKPVQHPPPANSNGMLPPRISSVPPQRASMINGPHPGPMKNGARPGSRVPSVSGVPPSAFRRGPSVNGHPPNGFPPPPNGYPLHGHPPRMFNGNGFPPVPGQLVKRSSFEGNNELEEFSHLMLYDNIPEGEFGEGPIGPYGEGMNVSSSDLALRERELMLRQKELALREQEYHMRRVGSRRPPPPHPSHSVPRPVPGGFTDDDDEDEDYFDPSSSKIATPPIDPESFDMMSMTSRRTRKAPSASQLRKNPEIQSQSRHRNLFGRSGNAKNRVSTRVLAEVPGLHDSLMDNPLMAYSSNRYGNVDRQTMGQESRASSLTAARLDELQRGSTYGAYPPLSSRLSTQHPPVTMSPVPKGNGRPSPPNGYRNGYPMSDRQSPPGGKPAMPRHVSAPGNAVPSQQYEPHAAVSNLYPPKTGHQVRSLTGSASASAGSGDSGASAPADSENSAHSSRSSLGPRPPIGVR